MNSTLFQLSARSFAYAVAVLWNDLYDDGLMRTDSVAEFKIGLKTHLFTKFFQSATRSVTSFLVSLLYKLKNSNTGLFFLKSCGYYCILNCYLIIIIKRALSIFHTKALK